jgi:hypothetical protein
VDDEIGGIESMADDAIGKARKFCDDMKVEKELREVITGIVGKLNRSNLSAGEGEKLARSLVKAYEHLKNVLKELG